MRPARQFLDTILRVHLVRLTQLSAIENLEGVSGNKVVLPLDDVLEILLDKAFIELIEFCIAINQESLSEGFGKVPS